MPRSPASPVDEAALARVIGGTSADPAAVVETVRGTGGDDVILAGVGNDYVATGGGNDHAFGEDGNDTMRAGAGNDSAFGGAGNDLLDGFAGADHLDGGAGDDSFNGGTKDNQADMAFGGEGNDNLVWQDSFGNDSFHGGPGNDTLILGLPLDFVLEAIRLEGGADLVVQVDDRLITFVDADGKPTTFSGSITYHHETVRFSDIEQIRIL